MKISSRYYCVTILFYFICTWASGAQTIEFSKAIIFSPSQEQTYLKKPITVLQEEIFKRTGLNLATTNVLDNENKPCIIILTENHLSLLPKSLQVEFQQLEQPGKDGFRLLHSHNKSTIIICGKDSRSILYGIGWLLRKSSLLPGQIQVPVSISISTTPEYAIRGHQLGYRPKTNAYDAFSVAQFDEYIRELALFGANSIEIVPPRTDDDATSKHMKLPPLQMIAEQSHICKSYGLDVWMWYPNMGTNYNNPVTVAQELQERATVFAAVEKLDAVFVPGGDPGDLAPDELFAWLKKEAAVLHHYHPNAKIWVSPQVFRPTKKWMDAFYKHINKKYSWLGGVVFGPWIPTPIATIRKKINPTIPIRIYPDITHSLSSQYPVPNWDLAFAMTLGRECINPRPSDEKLIHNAFAAFGSGSISYSEGTNDDVNKFVWSAQDWNSHTPVDETLEDYARFFIGATYAQTFAKGIKALEENFRGPLLNNEQVSKTLAIFQQLEQHATENLQQNFRFQMCLLRAYYDAFIQQRLVRETEIEKRVYGILASANQTASTEAIRQSNELLQLSMQPDSTNPYRLKCMALADSLFKSIGAQLTVQKHGATEGRGNFMDNIDVPLNDAPWLSVELMKILEAKNEPERLKRIDSILHRTDAGVDGTYTHFGTPNGNAFVVNKIGWNKDPGGLQSPLVNFGVGTKEDEWVHEILPKGFGGKIVPKAWMTQIGSLYQQPLQIQFDHLDTSVTYHIQLAYTGRLRSRIKLTANGFTVHDYLQTGEEPIYNFQLPKQATKTGKVLFNFICPEGEQGAQVSEIWLLKDK